MFLCSKIYQILLYIDIPLFYYVVNIFFEHTFVFKKTFRYIFHSVSINSVSRSRKLQLLLPLHSTMYLLIPRLPTPLIPSAPFLLFLSPSFNLYTLYIYLSLTVVLLTPFIYVIVDLPMFLHYHWSTFFICFPLFCNHILSFSYRN